MSLEELIKAKGDERISNKILRNDAFKQESVKLRDEIITKYGDRIDKMITTMNLIKDTDPVLWKTICPHAFVSVRDAHKSPNYFFTDGIYHHLGFYRNLSSIGYEAGGCCGDVDFIVTKNTCDFEMRGPEDGEYINYFSRECAKSFGKDFEKFETKFSTFINTQYGDGAYDL